MIPNVITPNGDGLNDKFDLLNREFYAPVTITIYNRWGQEVYHSANYQGDWPQDDSVDGVYYYRLGYLDEIKTGFINVVR